MGAIQLFDKLLPRHCVLCRARSQANLCAGCDGDLPIIHKPCFRCGIPLGHPDDVAIVVGGPPPVCGQCITRPPPFDCTIAPLEYAFPVTVLVQRFKFRRSLACGVVLSGRLTTALKSSLCRGDPLPDCLVPVPLHPTRQFFRVYNQAEVIACDVGKTLGISVKPQLLRRARQTSPQPGLSAANRRKNLKGAITAGPTSARHVAIVDDVMTTGATVSECARALKCAGVESVSVWVAARARGH